ncbi:Calcium-transporting ATPase 1, endoplasmic reticulum-type [Zea mays]|uniref:Calcium-transporting ATPase 1, endoplasmic reticulum-type n=1 Tax=Zea mays TaxID=4577 RepID=A0A3L6GFS2_MAIZE|nr:Calcium-transporting ATPase 1, endoplasmic reticulum-type [Zea mays]
MDKNSQMITKIVVVCNDAIIGHSEHQYVATGMPTKAALKLWSRKCISAKVPQDSEGFRQPDMHHGMEVRLGLSKGPICPSFS